MSPVALLSTVSFAHAWLVLVVKSSRKLNYHPDRLREAVQGLVFWLMCWFPNTRITCHSTVKARSMGVRVLTLVVQHWLIGLVSRPPYWSLWPINSKNMCWRGKPSLLTIRQLTCFLPKQARQRQHGFGLMLVMNDHGMAKHHRQSGISSPLIVKAYAPKNIYPATTVGCTPMVMPGLKTSTIQGALKR